MRRLLVIGLDCAPPELLFERFEDVMPTVRGLRERGSWGALRSSEPPITVPAWACMTSGRDPGELGLYGFRERVERSYEMRIADARASRVPRVWEYLGRAGRRVALQHIPLSWPPPPVRGISISCFLRPGEAQPWTFPPTLAAEIEPRFGPHRPDVRHHRQGDPEALLADLHESTRRRFALARYLSQSRRPDFQMMVEMGPDRLHHALWHAFEPTHPRFDPEGPYVNAARDYYAALDAEIRALIETHEAGGAEEAAVMLASDHGARSRIGGFRINEWLRRQGWLVLKEEPREPIPFDPARVDWSRTRAWAEGGYYARVFLNVRGREPEGTVEPSASEGARDALAAALEGLSLPGGASMRNRASRAERAYRKVRGQPPDLLVYLSELEYRSLGSVGPGPLFVEDEEESLDGCNHDWEGIFVLAGAGLPARGRIEGASLYDITPTILGALGVQGPEDLRGRDWSRA